MASEMTGEMTGKIIRGLTKEMTREIEASEVGENLPIPFMLDTPVVNY